MIYNRAGTDEVVLALCVVTQDLVRNGAAVDKGLCTLMAPSPAAFVEGEEESAARMERETVDSMRKASLRKGEVVNRASSSSKQRGVAAGAVGNVESSLLNRLDVSAPSYLQQFDGALLDIRPGSEFPATLRRDACP